jgi:hypothetical protein
MLGVAVATTLAETLALDVIDALTGIAVVIVVVSLGALPLVMAPVSVTAFVAVMVALGVMALFAAGAAVDSVFETCAAVVMAVVAVSACVVATLSVIVSVTAGAVATGWPASPSALGVLCSLFAAGVTLSATDVASSTTVGVTSLTCAEIDVGASVAASAISSAGTRVGNWLSSTSA